MKPISEVTAMIVDNGEFVDFARSLGRSYKKVYYHNPDWSSFYRSVNECQLGSGFEEIELVPGHDIPG